MNSIRVPALAGRLVILIALATLARTAAAAGPIVVQDPGATATAPLHAAFACSYEPGPLDPTTSYAAGDGWNWIAWHIPNQPCANCPEPGVTEARQVSFATRSFANCNTTVEVSIVASTGVECLQPDTTNVLYGPFSYPVAINIGVGDVHSIPLPTGWCLTRDSFVLIRFVGIDGCTTTKGSVGLDRANVACTNCQEWVTAINLWGTPIEECSIVPSASPIWIGLDTECCAATPTLERSWGSVKTHYR